MLQEQKEAILTLLKENEIHRTFTNKYLFDYKDFLNPLDGFTAFLCENFEGKENYVSLIETLLKADETAKIFVEVYGYEEDNNEQYIYADTMVVFSKLSLVEIKRIFNEPEDIFPSDVGEITDLMQHHFIMDKNGELLPAKKFVAEDCFAYYCWWD